jgi:hypothetical protein
MVQRRFAQVFAAAVFPVTMNAEGISPPRRISFGS